MTKSRSLTFAAIFALPLLPPAATLAEDARPSAYARFVPERKDDFAWENDKVAFRAYGPALRAGKENAGIDCWLKRVDYPIIDKWYKSGTYHKDHGEGLDNYHVGSSAGCGGTALWIEGKRQSLEAYTKWKIVEQTPEKTVFVLTYENTIDDSTYAETKRITLELGQRLFKAESTFTKNGEVAVGLAVAVGLTTHDGKAKPIEDPNSRWVAAWENLEGSGLGTAVVLAPAFTGRTEIISEKTPDESHALLVTETDAQGRVVYYAGYGWENAGEITTPEAWTEYLEKFNASLK